MKTLFIFIFLLAIIPVRGQGGGLVSENPPVKRNTLYLKTSVASVSSHFSIGVTPIAVEYDRRFTKYFSWVGGFAFTTLQTMDFSREREITLVRSYSLNSKIALTTNRDRRFFIRFETGFAAVFIQPDRSETEKITRFLPSVVAELYLGIKLGRNVELLLLPYASKFRYSPRRVVAGQDDHYFELFFYSAGLGVRF